MDRCRCGNRVPKDVEFREFGGTCRACARERQEKASQARKQAEFEALKMRYLSNHPFALYHE